MDILNWWKGLENSLDAAALRQKVIANNIANAGNPNITTQAVSFEDQMKKALAAEDGEGDLGMRPVSLEEGAAGMEDFNIKTEKGSWRFTRPKVYNTGKQVDVNQEMVNLAKNQIQYNMLVQKTGGMMKGFMNIIDQLDRR